MNTLEETLLENHHKYLEAMVLGVQEMGETRFTTGALEGYKSALEAFENLRKQLDIVKGE